VKLKKSLLHGTLTTMRNRWKSFVFENWEWNAQEQKLSLRYSFDGDVQFEENWWFDFEIVSNVPFEIIEKAFEGLWIAAGVSYFKAGIPRKIEFRKGIQTMNYKLQSSNYKLQITKGQAQFFEKVWMNGLGEFFFQNEIDPKGVVLFPEEKLETTNYKLQTSNLDLVGALLPIGGGKDSLVSAILLRSGNIDFETWTVGDSAVQTACCEALHVPRLKVRRQISPELLRLNTEGALNGHIPISSILAFAGVASALLRGKKYVVLSNEHSASDPNTEWNGIEINHQWSKSLQFEQEFQQYVSENISLEVKYFSLLRPLSELRIAEIFAKQGWDEFGSLFSSCNRNFHLGGSRIASRWCGTCPKCVFVSLILSPWLSATQIEFAFGSVPFADSENEALMNELLGLEGIKPLECVGTVAEAREAVVLGKEKHECLKSWAEKFPAPHFNHREWHEHQLPPSFEEVLKKVYSS
jgi:hypothetical protein